jgi:hypothetical protein
LLLFFKKEGLSSLKPEFGVPVQGETWQLDFGDRDRV